MAVAGAGSEDALRQQRLGLGLLLRQHVRVPLYVKAKLLGPSRNSPREAVLPLEEAMWRVHPSLTQDDMTEPTHDEGPL